ncbi:MAG: TetR/AcrR family transcriptional regulator [Deltaproteobacteria bacterium]|nr:TetR/AcrR family transcriptional regulator [Candidatus Zymogenaceae bacterium]
MKIDIVSTASHDPNNRYRKPEKVETLIKAAYTAIAKKGYAQVSLRDIADEAGVNKSLLHYYFKDKDELVMAVYRHVVLEIHSIIARVAALPISTVEKLRRGFQELLSFTEEKPEWIVVVMDLTVYGVQKDDSRLDIFTMHEQLKEIICGGLREAKRNGEIRDDFDEAVIATLSVALGNGLALLYCIARETTDLGTAYGYFTAMLRDFISDNEAETRRASIEG